MISLKEGISGYNHGAFCGTHIACSHMALFLDFMVTISYRYYWKPILQTMILRIDEGMHKGRWVRKRSGAPSGHVGFYFPWFPVNDSNVCSCCVSQPNPGPFCTPLLTGWENALASITGNMEARAVAQLCIFLTPPFKMLTLQGLRTSFCLFVLLNKLLWSNWNVTYIFLMSEWR